MTELTAYESEMVSGGIAIVVGVAVLFVASVAYGYWLGEAMEDRCE